MSIVFKTRLKTDGSVFESASSKSHTSNELTPLLPNQYHSSISSKHLENDEVRLKSAQMILNALRYAELPVGTLDPEDIAVRVEEKLFSVHKGTGDKYKAALRSRVFNLRDKKNPALRHVENVLTGVVKPDKFAIMTSEEMASDEVREMRDKFNKAAILEHQMSVQQGTPSDMFKCGKCGKKNCTYTQLQTRSSDEPMTTFVFCLECGNRWKFC
ncbi:transcription elongation factor S-II [Ostertagia ostertagi]